MLKFDHVSYAYPGSKVKVVDDLSFYVPPGKRIALLGLNGSGKSTIARLANGLLLPRKGNVSLDELNTKQREDIYQLRKRVGVIAQDPDNQIIASTVLDDVAFGLENLGLAVPQIIKQAKEALAAMGLSGYEDRDPNAMSGGEKQRLVIAGILAMDPEYYVFDEPSSMLDAVGRKEVLAAIDSIQKRGHGILHITHDLEEALAADTIFVLEKGRFLFSGTPTEFLDSESMRKIFEPAFSPYLQLMNLLKKRGIDTRLPDRLSMDLGATDAFRNEYPKNERDLDEIPSLDTSLDPTGLNVSVDPIGEPSFSSTSSSSEQHSSLVLSKASYSYDGRNSDARAALQEIDFKVSAGSYTLILGHSGSGKSTLLRLCSGLLEPTEGAAQKCSVPSTGSTIQKTSYDERGVTELLIPSDTANSICATIEAGDVGIIFQQPESQLFAQTVFEEVIFGPKNIGLMESNSDFEHLAETSLHAVGLDFKTLRDRSPFSLSGGEARRVAIACILAMQPQFVLFDEPTAGLDFKGRAFVHSLIADLISQEVGVVVVSHDLDEFLPRAHRAVVLEKGCIAWEGAASSLIGDPLPLEQLGLDLPTILAFQKGIGFKRGTYSYDPQKIASALASPTDEHRGDE